MGIFGSLQDAIEILITEADNSLTASNADIIWRCIRRLQQEQEKLRLEYEACCAEHRPHEFNDQDIAY